MSDVNYAFQANFKFGPQFKETLINVPANTPEEMLGKLKWLEENAASFVATHAALHGVEAVAPLAANVAHTQVQQEPAYQEPQAATFNPQQAQQTGSGWGQPQQSPPPQFAQPATAGPTCQHGPMVHRSGNKNGRDWSGWFCPTPKGTPNQCSPQFGK